MNKLELISKAAGQVGKTKKDVAKVVNAVTGTTKKTLSKGEKNYLGWLRHLSGYGKKDNR